jgi:hypothetical protein
MAKLKHYKNKKHFSSETKRKKKQNKKRLPRKSRNKIIFVFAYFIFYDLVGI